MDRKERVAGVVRALEHRLQLEGFDARAQLVGFLGQLRFQRGIGLLLEQLRHFQGRVDPLTQLLVRANPTLQRLDLLDRAPGRLGISPKPGVGLPSLERLQSR
jgi:hypothetical protein